MSEDPFELLGLPPRFHLPIDRIQSNWRQRTASLHPDRIARDGGAASEAEIARRAASLNHAKRALEDPERRAWALLRRIAPAEAARKDDALPEGFLVEILGVREQMEEARAGGAPLRQFEEWADTQRAIYIRRVGDLFEAVGEQPTADILRALRLELNAWRYIERMIEQLDPDASAHGAAG